MGRKSKQAVSQRVVASLVLCTAVLLSVLIVPGTTSAIEPSQQAAGERVEVALWSPSSWMVWLVGWLTGDVQVTQEAASADPCVDPNCTPPDTQTTDGGDTGGGGTDPTTEQGPVLDVTG